MYSMPHLPSPTEDWDHRAKPRVRKRTSKIPQQPRQIAQAPNRLQGNTQTNAGSQQPKNLHAGRTWPSLWWMSVVPAVVLSIFYLWPSARSPSATFGISHSLKDTHVQVNALHDTLQNWTQACSVLPPLRSLESGLWQSIVTVNLLDSNLSRELSPIIQSAPKAGKCQHLLSAVASAQSCTHRTTTSLRNCRTLFHNALSSLTNARSAAQSEITRVQKEYHRGLVPGGGISHEKSAQLRRTKSEQEAWLTVISNATQELQSSRDTINWEIKRYEQFVADLEAHMQTLIADRSNTAEGQTETDSQCSASDIEISQRLLRDDVVRLVKKDTEEALRSYSLLSPDT